MVLALKLNSPSDSSVAGIFETGTDSPIAFCQPKSLPGLEWPMQTSKHALIDNTISSK